MELKELIEFLDYSEIHDFFPNAFNQDVNDCSVVVNSGGTVERGGVLETHMRIITRTQHPMLTIDKAKEIRQHLYVNLKGAFFNGKKVLNVETTTPEPLPIGEEQGLHSASYNYIFLEG